MGLVTSEYRTAIKLNDDNISYQRGDHTKFTALPTSSFMCLVNDMLILPGQLMYTPGALAGWHQQVHLFYFHSYRRRT